MTMFENWMNQVDQILKGICFMNSEELPDYTYWDCFESGQDPKQTALEALANADYPMHILEEN